MDNFGTPANANTSLSQLLRNPKRELAIESIEQTIKLLEEADVPREMLCEVLFDKLTYFVVPDGELDAGNATIWYAQLQRMQAGLQRQIDLIEAELDKV